MATQTGWSCPICHDDQDGIASVMPCRHQFCLGCIVRWTEIRADCPLCRGPVETVRFSVREDNYLQYSVAPRQESPSAGHEEREAPSPHHPVASPPAEQGAAGTEGLGGLLPHIWAELFRRQERLLNPMLAWLHPELEAIYGTQWWRARNAESAFLHALCVYGPDEEVMIQRLQDHLEEHTERLVHAVINVIVQQCSEEAQRLLRSRAARANDSPAASSSSYSSSPSSSSSTAGATEAALRGDISCPSSAPGPAEQEQPQEEPVQAVEAAGPSAPGRSHSPTTFGQVRGPATRGACRTPKRRAPSPQDCPQPPKRLRRRRH
ncbi:TOPRS ligase, partial [Baryphthengus martii]|nr:TOPRS ligase [Baryphthengus martii]